MLTGQILLQLIVILLAVQLFGFLCKLIGQQWVIGEILAGLALGPSLLGSLLPGVKAFVFPAAVLPTLQTLGDIGLILYMFSLGARLDTHLMLRQSRSAIITSISGILLPLVLGAVLAFFLFPSLAGAKTDLVSFMLLIGTAIAITAFPVLARLLTEKQMLGTKIGTLALTCAAVDDVTAWCLLALVIAVVHATGLISVAFTVGLTLLFIGCMVIVVRPLLAYAYRHISSKPLLVALSIVLLLLSAYFTNMIGIHPVFGAFLMGIILPRKTVFIELVRSIDQVNGVLFLPLFFVYSGLRTQIGLIDSPWLILICLLILVVACAGKIFGGTFAVRIMGESWKDAFSLGILMNTRGLVELIVLNIGLDLGVLSPTLFAMLVIMAIVTTMMASPLLPLLGYKQRTPGDTNNIEERERGSTQEQVS
ncbi:MAG TPA: cation:proton antiporter [Ktedonobacteraceae bacterium]|nr:cation:proton antiporter [Ktedonobacteraceae bacterium]